MKLVQRGKNWGRYEVDGKILVMSTDRRIGERMMEKCQ